MNNKKPCIKCGSTDRVKSGQCRICKKRIWDAYCLKNGEAIKRKNAEYRELNREKVNAATVAWQKSHPEELKAMGAKYRANNKEKIKEKRDAARAENRESFNAYQRNYIKSHPEINIVKSQNYRARKLAAVGCITKGLREKLFKLQRGKCACCRLPLGDNYHLDHIVPLALGGANEDWNIQLLRQSCNSQKSAKHPIDFMQSKGFLL